MKLAFIITFFSFIYSQASIQNKFQPQNKNIFIIVKQGCKPCSESLKNIQSNCSEILSKDLGIVYIGSKKEALNYQKQFSLNKLEWYVWSDVDVTKYNIAGTPAILTWDRKLTKHHISYGKAYCSDLRALNKVLKESL